MRRRLSKGHVWLTGAGLALIVLTLLAIGPDAPSFFADFERDSLSQRAWQIDADERCRIGISSARSREGSQSLRIDAPKDDRCELVPRLFPAVLEKFYREPFGQDRWYSFSVFAEDLGDSARGAETDTNTVIAQWHSSPDPFIGGEPGRSPPLALRIRNGHWGITYGSDAKFRSTEKYIAGTWHLAGPVELGRWTDWRFHVRWSYKSDGLTEIWRDGELVMRRFGPNTFNDLRGVYLKVGLYHPVEDSIIYLDSLSITDNEH